MYMYIILILYLLDIDWICWLELDDLKGPFQPKPFYDSIYAIYIYNI